jgi:DNA-binding NtrC family response regulator
MRVLVVDDQRSALRVLTQLLAGLGVSDIEEAMSLEKAREALAGAPFDLAFVDIRLSDEPQNRDGLTLLAEIRGKHPTAVVMVTAISSVPEIRTAIRAGAWDYVLKGDLCDDVLRRIVEDHRERMALQREVLEHRQRSAPPALHALIGTSPAMQRVREMVRRVAVSDRPVLVVGPSGAGKELVVKAIHALGPHPASPLLDVNCGAFPETLMEDQLFGHEKGAFTGADRRREGYCAAVRDGTLFLDEIAELPLLLQPKLLRVLEERRFRAVGATSSTQDVTFSGRVVAATHVDLAERVRSGKFRQDLFYRLNVLQVRVPPLSERPEDIAPLVAHFAARQERPLHFAEDALTLLQRMEWLGNVRQLRNLVDRLAVLTDDDPITARSIRAVEQLPAVEAGDPFMRAAELILDTPQRYKLAAIEHALIQLALSRNSQNKSAAAKLLGVHRKYIERRTRGGDGREGPDELDGADDPPSER